MVRHGSSRAEGGVPPALTAPREDIGHVAGDTSVDCDVAGSYQKGYQYLVSRYASNACILTSQTSALAPVAVEPDHISYISCARIFIENGRLGGYCFESNDASSTCPQLSNDPGVEGILGENDAYLLCCICLIYSVGIYQLRSWELWVKNTHLQFPHARAIRSFTVIRYQSNPYLCGIRQYRLCTVLRCERS